MFLLTLLQGQIKKLEPLLAALAAVPWIHPDAEDGQRVPFITTTVLDEVEGMGRLCQFAYPQALYELRYATSTELGHHAAW